MTSERKAISNRKNAQKSTGPRSDIGLRHSRGNALRHGLAIAIESDPLFINDIEALATALAEGAARRTVDEFARQVAEAEFELRRIRKLEGTHYGTILSNPDATLDDYAELGDTLAKLDRYRRRAVSRRKRAMLAMRDRKDKAT